MCNGRKWPIYRKWHSWGFHWWLVLCQLTTYCIASNTSRAAIHGLILDILYLFTTCLTKCVFNNSRSPVSVNSLSTNCLSFADDLVLLKQYDVITWKHFPRYWSFARGIHRSPVNSPHKSQRPGALMFYSICSWINGWVNNREAGDLRRHLAHYYVSVIRNWTFWNCWLKSI